MKRIINFSGGKSSALMTILEYNPDTDYVVFCDSGRVKILDPDADGLISFFIP